MGVQGKGTQMHEVTVIDDPNTGFDKRRLTHDRLSMDVQVNK